MASHCVLLTRLLIIAIIKLSVPISGRLTPDESVIRDNGGVSGKSVSILWGLPDRVAYVGQLLRYKIPQKAFKGSIASFRVMEATEDHLPDWLSYDDERQEIFGVPSLKNLGPVHIQVQAVGIPINKTHASMAEDIFTLNVREETLESRRTMHLNAKVEGGAVSNLICSGDEPSLMFSLTLHGDVDKMEPKDRRNLVESIATTFSVPSADLIRLYARSYLDDLKRHVLLAGPGNMPHPSNLGNVVASWPIGCGRKAPKEEAYNGLVKKVGNTPGKLDVVSWNVATLELRNKRRRRSIFQFLKTQTPDPTSGVGVPPKVHSTVILTPSPSTKLTVKTTTSTTPPPPPSTKKPTTKRSIRPSATAPPRTRPELMNAIDKIICYEGSYCEFKIPKDTFYDAKDGATDKLDLSFIQGSDLDERQHFMFIDQDEQLIYGLPLAGNEGVFNYVLRAQNSRGEFAGDALQLEIKKPKVDSSTVNHVFHMRMAKNYRQWRRDTMLQIEVLRKIAQFFGSGNDISGIVVDKVESGSVILDWYNKTLGVMEVCPKQALNNYYKLLFQADGKQKNHFLSFMQRYGLTNSSVALKNNCEGVVLPLQSSGTGSRLSTPVPIEPEETVEEPKVHPAGKSRQFYTTIIPIIVIVILLILAATCAFCLYRRRKKPKYASGDSAKNQTYISKGGKPVVFPGEITDDRDASATTPMLTKEERPPLPTPDYVSANGNGTTPGRSRGGVTGEEMSELGTFGRGGQGNDGPFGGQNATVAQNPIYQPPPPPGDLSSSMRNNRSPRPHTSTPQNTRTAAAHIPP